jgi:hypothetical protein
MTAEMTSEMYHRGYWEDGDGSNYRDYGNDPGWAPTVDVLLQIGTVRSTPWLEVGCAKGFFVETALGRDVPARGYDLSEYAVGEAWKRNRVLQRRVIVGNAAEMPAAAPTWVGFGLVCSWEMLEHVPFGYLDSVLTGMADSGRPGAWQVHRIGIADGPGSHHHNDDVTHQPAKPRSWWEAQFASHGWRRHEYAEGMLDEAFRGRDWAGRFFVYRQPGVSLEAVDPGMADLS